MGINDARSQSGVRNCKPRKLRFSLYLDFYMQHREFQVSEQLRNVIACFWHITKGRPHHPASFEVQPDGYAEIIFYFGNTCSILQNGKLLNLPSPFIVGLLEKPAVFYIPGQVEIIGIRCYPWTVFDLLGLPVQKTEIQRFEHPIAHLQPVLNTFVKAGQLDQAVDKLQHYFLQSNQANPDVLVSRAGNVMRRENGSIPVSELAASAHATLRTLERKFKRSAGHTIKNVSALIRFEQVRNALWNNPGVNLASLAHELGYTDQAHLSREFKRYSGSSPRAFAKTAVDNRGKLDFVAFIQA